MEPGVMISALSQRLPAVLTAVDCHTAGEITRLIIGGVGPLEGETMAQKRFFLMKNLDHVRCLTCTEPRGHRHLLAALVTEPVTAGADFGLIFMDARRYPYACGTATMAAVTVFIESGLIPADGPDKEVVVDTPSGPMRTSARIDHGEVESVGLEFPPSFVLGLDQTLKVPDRGAISVDTVCVGGFFAMVAADQVGLELSAANSKRLVDWGMAVIEAANEQLAVRHPTRPEVQTVDVTQFYDPKDHARGRGLTAVIYGEAHLDRSPCGTGTAAKMTLLHHQGRLALHEPFLNAGPLGTTFAGRIVAETRVGDLAAVKVEVRGSAFVIGLNRFTLEPGDPFPQGFMV